MTRKFKNATEDSFKSNHFNLDVVLLPLQTLRHATTQCSL